LRRLLFILLLFVLSVWSFRPVEAASQRAVFTVGGTYYVQDDRQVKMDCAPFLNNGHVFLPVRYLAYALGISEGDIRWDERGQLLTLIKGAYTVTLRPGSKTLYSSSGRVNMDVAPLSKNGHIYLPAACIAAAFGYRSSWDPAEMTVTIAPQKETLSSASLRVTAADLRPGQYVVQPGDSLLLIARRFGVSMNDLLAANGQLKDVNLIYPGQVLIIPAAVCRHVVAPGETLSQIAAEYRLSQQDILALNPQIKRADRLYAGQVLLLPGSDTVAVYD